MVIKKYSDLEKVNDNMIVDINRLCPKLSVRVLDYLCGLTRNGYLKKLERGKYLVKIMI